MFVLYLAFVAPSIVAGTTSTIEPFPLNDPSDLYTPEESSTYNYSLSNDLVYLDARGSFSMENRQSDRNQPGDISSDVNDFIGLIPVDEVRVVMGNYYRSDPDVRSGFTYLRESHFFKRLQNVTEIRLLIRYINETGLDVEKAVDKLFDVIGNVEMFKNAKMNSATDSIFGNDTEVEYSGGMHVMVDSVLEVIPQDEILNMFFEKMDSSPAFTVFFDKIREPKFTLLLQRLEESAEMKYIIYDLHNHGINMEKIVDSLKNYFFLGTFN